MTDSAPSIPNTPGIRWRRRNNQWEAFWRARSDLVKRGFEPKNRWLWRGHVPTEFDAAHMSDTCTRLQDAMLLFSRGGLPAVFDGTLRALINCYQTDEDSTYQKLRYHVRVRTDFMLRRISNQHGTTALADIKGRTVKAWHNEWTGDGEKLAIGHAFVGTLRTLCSFGFTMLEDEESERVGRVLGKMRFPSSSASTERMTADQANAIRKEAHATGWPSVALAQAFQFELMLRQKDVIGEWVPLSEPGTSDVTNRGRKWLRGLRWSEVDQNLILRHVTSKRGKELEVNLKLAPMIMEEMDRQFPKGIPAAGPIVMADPKRIDTKRIPWLAGEFRRRWRLIARAAGVPDEVMSMHSRHGGISEATDAGADIESVRHAATHSNSSQTQKYSRNSKDKIANVMQIRSAHRNKAPK